MDDRYAYATSMVRDRNSRILEIGPLNRPIFVKAEYPNCFYCDIRSTEEIKTLYCGNEYLQTTGITVDVSSIVDIDFVLAESYNKTFANIEKFDYVVMSHVLEHVDDILRFLDDISSVLKPNGLLIIIYPDKRYCFDHFRQEASFRDALDVSLQGYKANARMVFDFLFKVINENEEPFFWQAKEMERHLPTNSFDIALDAYKRVQSGQHEDDVHYWPFSDRGFLEFLYDCTRAGMLCFSCIDFIPTKENTQQFFVSLRYDKTVLQNIEEHLELIRKIIASVPVNYRSSGHLRMEEKNAVLQQENLMLQTQLQTEVKQKLEMQACLETQNSRNAELQSKLETQNLQNSEMESQLLALEERYRQLELDMSKQIEKCEQIEKQSEQQRAQLEMILTSNSWKVTEPLRRIVDFVKRK